MRPSSALQARYLGIIARFDGRLSEIAIKTGDLRIAAQNHWPPSTIACSSSHFAVKPPLGGNPIRDNPPGPKARTGSSAWRGRCRAGRRCGSWPQRFGSQAGGREHRCLGEGVTASACITPPFQAWPFHGSEPGGPREHQEEIADLGDGRVGDQELQSPLPHGQAALPNRMAPLPSAAGAAPSARHPRRGARHDVEPQPHDQEERSLDDQCRQNGACRGGCVGVPPAAALRCSGNSAVLASKPAAIINPPAAKVAGATDGRGATALGEDDAERAVGAVEQGRAQQDRTREPINAEE